MHAAFEAMGFSAQTPNLHKLHIREHGNGVDDRNLSNMYDQPKFR